MATIDPIRFSDLTLMLGDGAEPEVFTAPCGLTDYTWTTSIQTNDEDLPDCENPDAPGYQSPNVVSTGDQLTSTGFVDAESHELWLEFARSGEPRNVRLVYAKGTNAAGGRNGYYQGPVVITNREEAYARRASGRINLTLVFKAPPVWTPLP